MAENIESLMEAFAVNPHPAAKFIARSYYIILDEGLAKRFRPYSMSDIAPELFEALMEKDFDKISLLWLSMTGHMKRSTQVGPIFQLAQDMEAGMEEALARETSF